MYRLRSTASVVIVDTSVRARSIFLILMLSLLSSYSLHVGRINNYGSRWMCMSTAARQLRKTGSFIRSLPDIHSGSVHYKRAVRKTKAIKIDSSIKNVRNANRKYAAMMMDALMKGLTVPLTDMLKAYERQMRKLHPFEQTVVELTVTARVKAGQPDLQMVLSTIKSLRATTSRIAKEYAAKANNAATAIEAKDLQQEGFEILERLYAGSENAMALDELAAIQKDLRRIPLVELDLPTVVLVGAPNVGKSSLVRAVSSGTPEVNDYPFTTRGVTIGHIVDADLGLRFQVMDTPGLLDRAAEERNEMEKLTFASMAHLPTAVMFVIDASGLSGSKSTLQAQLNVRRYLRDRFPQRPWLDVLSKADLTLPEEVKQQLPEDFLPVSVQDGTNVEVLQQRLEDMLLDLRDILQQRFGQNVNAADE